MTEPMQHNRGRRRWQQAVRWLVLVAAVAMAWPLSPKSSTSVFLPAASPFLAFCSAVAARSVDVLMLLAEGRECTACLRHCPCQALAMQSADGGFSNFPRVDLSRCTGCGACEAVCPVRPRRAIRVVARPGRLAVHS